MNMKEIDRFNKKINEALISMSAKKALCNVVEEFFLVNYENISEKRKREVEVNFKLRRNLSILWCDKSDVVSVERIFDQIENSLFTILDQSIDKERKSSIEKIISSIPSFHIHKK